MKYGADMGAIKIVFTDSNGKPTGSCFFGNGYGDGMHDVFITKKEPQNSEFLEHFTIIEKGYLARFDCDMLKLKDLKQGRWFVFRKGYKLYLVWTDAETHS